MLNENEFFNNLSFIKNRKFILKLILIILIIVFLSLTYSEFKKIIVIIFFLVINIIVALMKRLIIKRFINDFVKGIELIMFSTIIISFAYGSKMGMLVGGLSMVINYIFEGRFSIYFVLTIPLYMIIGYLSWFFNQTDVVLYSIIVLIIYNLTNFILVSLIHGQLSQGMIKFTIANILFNFFLFNNFGQIILNLIKI